MESYRVYKSLPVDDFMDMTSFVVAKIGLDLIPLIQNTNQFRKIESHTDEYIKERFILDTKKQLELCYEHLEKEMNVMEMDRYYMFVPIKKNQFYHEMDRNVR